MRVQEQRLGGTSRAEASGKGGAEAAEGAGMLIHASALPLPGDRRLGFHSSNKNVEDTYIKKKPKLRDNASMFSFRRQLKRKKIVSAAPLGTLQYICYITLKM